MNFDRKLIITFTIMTKPRHAYQQGLFDYTPREFLFRAEGKVNSITFVPFKKLKTIPKKYLDLVSKIIKFCGS